MTPGLTSTALGGNITSRGYYTPDIPSYQGEDCGRKGVKLLKESIPIF